MTGRELRLIVTQGCNYDCTFCHKEGLQTKQKDNFDESDYGYLFSIGKKRLNLDTTTLSGGEPLFRKDIVEIAKKLSQKGAKIVLTTNGFLLKERIEIGNYLKRINISLHVLDKIKYENLVRRTNTYEKVKNNLFLFKEKFPNVEIRLNATLIEGINTSKAKIREYIELANKLNASIKFLELYPKEAEGFFSLEKLEKILLDLGFKKVSSDNRKKVLKNDKTKIILGKIFCAFAEGSNDPSAECKQYNDLFITPEGKIKPCRSILREIDILEDVKGRNEEALINKIILSFSLLGEDCKCLNCINYGGCLK
ncbi:radical SAM protein [Candidatus Pacearchaeota archaeon]|nr:radical SAM protein [Candidatus Pacearchaeota archaeon]